MADLSTDGVPDPAPGIHGFLRRCEFVGGQTRLGSRKNEVPAAVSGFIETAMDRDG
jgi:hypothetical protein